MTDTLKHIRAMQETALALEAEARANGRYSRSRDCFTRDCDRVSDALRRGMKSGFAFLIGEDGEPEIIPLGEKAGKVEVTKGKAPDNWGVTYNQAGPRSEKQRDETSKIVEEGGASYSQMGGEEFAKAASRSHAPGEKTKGRFEPTNTADAARIARELKAKQERNTADAKRFNAEQLARNERIAAAMKQRSAEIHK
jgi:hypothetical protein